MPCVTARKPRERTKWNGQIVGLIALNSLPPPLLLPPSSGVPEAPEEKSGKRYEGGGVEVGAEWVGAAPGLLPSSRSRSPSRFATASYDVDLQATSKSLKP
jgi:hypothetical protein